MKNDMEHSMFNTLLLNALREESRHLGDELMTEEELRKAGEEIPDFSPEFEEKMEALIKKTRKVEKRNGHRTLFGGGIAAAVAFLLSKKDRFDDLDL